MIIENRWFILQGPRRVDLSGRPFGFLFIWLSGERTPPRGRFAPITPAREFGLFLPISMTFFDRWRKIERFECCQFVERDRPFPHDAHEWPQEYLRAAQKAASDKLGEYPKHNISKVVSFCDRRADLAGRPLQLTFGIILKAA